METRGFLSAPKQLPMLICLVFTSACSSGLASLENKQISLTLKDDALNVTIDYDSGGEERDRCITLDLFRGTLNGVDFDVVSAGRRYIAYNEVQCEPPQLRMPRSRFPAGGSATILISDHTVELRIEAPTLLEPRVLSIASATPGVIHVAEELTLSWTPQTDSFGPPSPQPTSVFRRGGTGDLVFHAYAPGVIDLIDTQHVRLRVPATEPGSGELPVSGTLTLDILQPLIIRCDRSRCTAQATYSADTTLTSR
jgi:hypothetical protein